MVVAVLSSSAMGDDTVGHSMMNMMLQEHGSCHLDNGMIELLCHTIVLWGVWRQGHMLDAGGTQECLGIVSGVFTTIVGPQGAYAHASGDGGDVVM